MASFPYKLYQLLTNVEGNEELSAIISWLPSTDGFRIHEPEVFEEVLLRKFFPKQSKLKSFKRQLQYYGFENLGRNSYKHNCLRRGHKSLCGKILHKLPVKRVNITAPTTASVKKNSMVPRRESLPTPSEMNAASTIHTDYPSSIIRRVSTKMDGEKGPSVATIRQAVHPSSMQLPHPAILPGRALELLAPNLLLSPTFGQLETIPSSYLKLQDLDRVSFVAHQYNQAERNASMEYYMKQFWAKSA
eukprot:scaffold9069_cov90-Cylindrotheca_fusiformis.AAC.4